MLNRREISFIREMCYKTLSALNLIECVTENAELCGRAEEQMRRVETTEDTFRLGLCKSVKREAQDAIEDYGFSILMCAMGEGTPKTIYSCYDYSVLYGNIGEKGETWSDDE